MSSSKTKKTTSRPAVDSRRQIFVALALIIAATIALRAPLLSIPFERDEGEYAYIGWRLERGELPYRDWVDQKPPAIFWVYRIALSLPIEPIRAVHLLALISVAASACALFFLARRFVSYPGAVIAAVLFALLLSDPMINGTAANTELFMLLPLIIAQLLFFRAIENESRRFLLALACGALLGLAAAFKQVAAVNWLLLIAVFPIFLRAEKRWRETFIFAGALTAGAASLWGAIAIYFWMRNGVSAFIENVFTHNLEYVRGVAWSVRWQLCRRTLDTLAPTQVLVWVMAIAGLIGQLLTGKTKSFLFWFGSLITATIGVCAGGYFFAHYFQQLLPALCVTAVLGCAWTVSWRRFARWFGIPFTTFLLLMLPVIRTWPFLTSYTPAEAVRKIYPGNFFADMPEVGARLQRLTSPADKVFLFAAEPEILFYAQRVSATRYIFLNPLYGPYADALQKQQAAADEVIANRPAAAITLPNRLFRMPGSEQYFTTWSDSYLRENFRPNAYLVIDSDLVKMVNRVETGQRLLGGVLVRKDSTTR